MRADLRRDRSASTHGNGNDDEICAFDRGGVGFLDVVGEAELGDAPARCSGAGGRDDRACRLLCARGACNRGADQAHSDERNAVENGPAAHLPPMNSRNADTTSRFASSLPTVMRSAFGSL